MDRLTSNGNVTSISRQRLITFKNSQRLIYDTLLAQEVKPHMFEVMNGLVVSCKPASSKYVPALEKEKIRSFCHHER